MLFWHVPAPNEALLVSGSRSREDDDLQFRIVTGHGCFVLPVKQRARTLSLALRESEIVEDCVTIQGVRLTIQAVAAFKVGDDPTSIANAARRFLTEQDRLEELVGRIFAGHLRSIVGALTVEQLIRERDLVAQEVKEASHSEMEKLGIVVDALQIQEIVDKSGYIDHLAAPHAAAVASQARIAAAQADREAVEKEQEAAALKAAYERETAIKVAGFAAETEQARASAAQAGPLAEARATQEVIEQQTALARRQAELADQELEATVRRPADAEAYRLRTLADAKRDQVKAEAEAGAYALLEHARSQAEANELRAASLRGGNQELIAANQLIDVLPALVEAAAKGLAGSSLTVLNGTSGLNEMLTGLVGQGLTIFEALKAATAHPADVPKQLSA
ncbi:SPFH domain-containing protein [Jatrophihabitans sp.]|uniref:SPFH domain-containing protein n=1 Tax=Jatrophihabitans sp. TaxID=1932789 RepID=UPI0030C75E22|nr:flotillin family protein [Jatrophihabitans sp.]